MSTATLADNFCNGWSGGLNFLQYRYSGSEVSVEPNGNVYPCCMKTQLAVGNLLEERLKTILDRLVGDPVYEAISMGHPERMGISVGWSVDTFLEKSQMTLPGGGVYQNLCIGCDAFHREVLMGDKTWAGQSKTYKYNGVKKWDYSGRSAYFARFTANSDMPSIRPSVEASHH